MLRDRECTDDHSQLQHAKAVLADIRSNDPNGKADLLSLYECGLRLILAREYDADSVGLIIDQTLLEVIEIIREGDMVAASELPKLVQRTMRELAPARPRTKPQVDQAGSQLLRNILMWLSLRQQHALRLFYCEQLDEVKSSEAGEMSIKAFAAVRAQVHQDFECASRLRALP